MKRTAPEPTFTPRRTHSLFAMCMLLLVLMIVGGLVAPMARRATPPAYVSAAQ